MEVWKAPASFLEIGIFPASGAVGVSKIRLQFQGATAAVRG
jgi:hypothetical protein